MGAVALCGSVLLNGSRGGNVQLWSIASEEGERITTLEGGATTGVSGLALSALGGFVASLTTTAMSSAGGGEAFQATVITWQPAS